MRIKCCMNLPKEGLEGSSRLRDALGGWGGRGGSRGEGGWGAGGCFFYLEKQVGRCAAAEAEQNQKFVGRSPRKAITCSDGTGLKTAAGDDKDKRVR